MGGGEEGRNGFSFPPHLPFYGRGKGEGGGRGGSEMPVKRMTRMIHNHNNTRCDEKDRAVVRKTGKERDGGDALILLPSSLLCFFSFSVLRFVESCAQNVRSSCSVCSTVFPEVSRARFRFGNCPLRPSYLLSLELGRTFRLPPQTFPSLLLHSFFASLGIRCSKVPFFFFLYFLVRTFPHAAPAFSPLAQRLPLNAVYIFAF